MKKYFIEVMFEDETIAEMAKDGLSYRFIPKDVITLLKDLPSNSIGGSLMSQEIDTVLSGMMMTIYLLIHLKL